MTNDIFLLVKLNQKNKFRTTASFEINGMKFSAVDVKIDTGCPHTSFPMLKLGLSEEAAYRLKEKDPEFPLFERAQHLQIVMSDILELEKRICQTSLEIQKYEKRLQKQ